jgi:hypothetical protein
MSREGVERSAVSAAGLHGAAHLASHVATNLTISTLAKREIVLPRLHAEDDSAKPKYDSSEREDRYQGTVFSNVPIAVLRCHEWRYR